MDAGQVALIGLGGTILGAAIAGAVALLVTKLNNNHAAKLATDEREHADVVRRRTAGTESAKAVLGQLDRIRAVFDHFSEDWNTPDQELYEGPYREVLLAAVDIDDDAAAKTLTDIAEVYMAAWLATELGEWRPSSLNRSLFALALATVRAYTQDDPMPDRAELDRMQREIEGRWAEREEQEREAREEERATHEERRARRAASHRPKNDQPAAT